MATLPRVLLALAGAAAAAPELITRSTKNSRHSSSDTNHGLSPLSTSRTLPQLPTKDPSDNSLTWSTSAPRPVAPPTPRNEDRV